MRDRDTQQINIALRGDAPKTIGRHTLRPLTFADMLVLQKLGHPLAGIGTGAEPLMTDMQAAEAIWVLAAPWDEVREVTLQCTAMDKTPVERAVLDFAAGISPDELAAMLKAILGTAEDADAVAAEVIADNDHHNASKN